VTDEQQAAFTAATHNAAQHDVHSAESATQSTKATSEGSVVEPSSTGSTETPSSAETVQVSTETETTREGVHTPEVEESTSVPDPTPVVSHAENQSQGHETEHITTTSSAASSIEPESTATGSVAESKIDRPVDEL
jgi:hypothetical protein